MEIELKTVWASRGALNALINNAELAKSVAAKISYRIATLAATLEPVLGRIETSRKALVEKYGKMDDKTGQFTVQPENTEAFMKEFNDLLATKEEIAVKPVELPEDVVGVTPAVFYDLNWCLTVHTEPELRKAK